MEKADAGITGGDEVTEQVVETIKKSKLIVKFGVEVENVIVEAAIQSDTYLPGPFVNQASVFLA